MNDGFDRIAINECGARFVKNDLPRKQKIGASSITSTRSRRSSRQTPATVSPSHLSAFLYANLHANRHNAVIHLSSPAFSCSDWPENPTTHEVPDAGVAPMLNRNLLLASLIALGVTSLPANARVDVDVRIAPPIPRIEIVPPPRLGYVWAPGFWHWEGRHHVWISGHWNQARPGHRWISERWSSHDRGYRFEPGHWEQDRGHDHRGRG
jgi:hypothetical protein